MIKTFEATGELGLIPGNRGHLIDQHWHLKQCNLFKWQFDTDTGNQYLGTISVNQNPIFATCDCAQIL